MRNTEFMNCETFRKQMKHYFHKDQNKYPVIITVGMSNMVEVVPLLDTNYKLPNREIRRVSDETAKHDISVLLGLIMYSGKEFIITQNGVDYLYLHMWEKADVGRINKYR